MWRRKPFNAHKDLAPVEARQNKPPFSNGRLDAEPVGQYSASIIFPFDTSQTSRFDFVLPQVLVGAYSVARIQLPEALGEQGARVDTYS